MSLRACRGKPLPQWHVAGNAEVLADVARCRAILGSRLTALQGDLGIDRCLEQRDKLVIDVRDPTMPRLLPSQGSNSLAVCRLPSALLRSRQDVPASSTRTHDWQARSCTSDFHGSLLKAGRSEPRR